MWQCDCDEHGVVRPSFAMSATTVNEEEQCVRCKNYAVWVKDDAVRADDGACIHRKVTVFRLTNNTFKHFDNLKEASEWIGYKSNESLSRGLGAKKKYFYSSPKRVAVCEGYYTKMPYELQQLVEKHLLYAICFETGKLLAQGTYDELAKALDVPKPSVVASVKRGYVNKKCNCVFTSNKNFNLEAFKASKGKGFSSNKTHIAAKLTKNKPVFHSEFTSYDDNELGVSYTKDTYGTWQDLLYT